MSLTEKIHTMDKRLRAMLAATALLFVPQIGQFVTIRDLNTTGQAGGLALLFMVVAILVVPTSLIVTGAIIALIYKDWRRHERLIILGLINLLIVINLTWFFLHQCSWSQVFGLTLQVCQ